MPMGVFLLRGATLGIFCLLLYAAVRPRLGPGVKTALTVGILVFLVGTLFPPFGLTMQAYAQPRLLLETIIWNAIQLPLATVAGSWLYREGTSEHDPAQLALRGLGAVSTWGLRLRRSPRLPRRIAELQCRVGGVERRISLK